MKVAIIGQMKVAIIGLGWGGGTRQVKVAIIGTYRSRGSARVATIGTDLGGVLTQCECGAPTS
jgi:hypothetical protein